MFSSTSASLSKLNSVRVCVYVHMNECMCVLEECVCVWFVCLWWFYQCRRSISVCLVWMYVCICELYEFLSDRLSKVFTHSGSICQQHILSLFAQLESWCSCTSSLKENRLSVVSSGLLRWRSGILCAVKSAMCVCVCARVCESGRRLGLIYRPVSRPLSLSLTHTHTHTHTHTPL